jgi:hypothetical protein
MVPDSHRNASEDRIATSAYAAPPPTPDPSPPLRGRRGEVRGPPRQQPKSSVVQRSAEQDPLPPSVTITVAAYGSRIGVRDARLSGTTSPSIRISNSRHTSAFSRREAPEACVSLSLQREGAGNAGCTLHPRSRVQSRQENRTRAYRAAEAIRHSLRNGFTTYIALTPGYRAFLPPSPRGNRHSGPVGLSHLRET